MYVAVREPGRVTTVSFVQQVAQLSDRSRERGLLLLGLMGLVHERLLGTPLASLFQPALVLCGCPTPAEEAGALTEFHRCATAALLPHRSELSRAAAALGTKNEREEQGSAATQSSTEDERGRRRPIAVRMGRGWEGDA